jgi:hypothetical protein
MPLERYVTCYCAISRNSAKLLQNVPSVDTVNEHLNFAHTNGVGSVQVGGAETGVAGVVQVAHHVEVLARGDRDGFRQLQNSSLLRSSVHHSRSSAIKTENSAARREIPAGGLELRLVADRKRNVHLVGSQLVHGQGASPREPQPHAQGQHDVRVVRRESGGDRHVGPVGQAQVGTVEQTSLLLHGGGGRGVGVSADQGVPIGLVPTLANSY